MAAEAGSGRPLVGRVEIVEALHRRLEDARAGTGGVTLLVGETGVGKSTLVRELVGEIRRRGILVLVGRAPALDDPPPFSLLRSAFESLRDDPTFHTTNAPPYGGDNVLIGFAPRLEEAPLPNLVSVEERLLDALGGVDDRGSMSRDRVLSDIADQFVEFTHRGPTVLILEDLHHADDSSLMAVEFLAARLHDERLWVLATSRPYASLSDSGRERLEKFETSARARQVLLRPLTSGEVAEYLQVTDPSREYSPAEVARRFSETGGNPLLLDQLDHAVAPGGTALPFPQAELPPLDPDAERVLDVAAVLGSEFPFAFLLRASGEQDEERFTETVDRLVALGVLFERPGEVLAFPEDRIREKAYDRLTGTRRELLHWSAGEAMESMGKAGVATTYALARHFYLGRAGAKSVKYNRMAAEIADRAFAWDVAREHLLRALEGQRALRTGNITTESELVLDLARVTEGLGELAESERVLREFLEREKNDPRLTISRRSTLEVFLGRVLSDRGDHPAAAAIAKRILALPEIEDQLLVCIAAHHLTGPALYYEGRYSEALSDHAEELRLARKTGNTQLILHAQYWHAATLAMMGQMEEAVAEAREVTAARDQLGSVRESAQAHLYFGDILADARCTPAQRAEAIAEYDEALRFAEKAQDPRRAGYALYKTTELLREAGRLDEASGTVARAIETLERVGDMVGRSVALKARAQIAMDRGLLEPAEADLTEAHQRLQGLQHRLEETDVVLRLAQLAQMRGDRATARKWATELDRLELSKIRPDLSKEFDLVRAWIAAGEGDGTHA